MPACLIIGRQVGTPWDSQTCIRSTHTYGAHVHACINARVYKCMHAHKLGNRQQAYRWAAGRLQGKQKHTYLGTNTHRQTQTHRPMQAQKQTWRKRLKD